MKVSTVMGYIGLVASAAVLSACSIAKNPAHVSTGASNPNLANNTAAQTYGLKTTGGVTAGNGMHVNTMTAPNNQTYYFAFNSDTMKSNDMQALHAQTGYLVTHPEAKVTLQGNTDDRGSREYNVALGWRRDQSVARLMEQQGVKPSQINMVSFGKEKPVAFGENEQSWALNRRVNLVYKVY